MPAKLQAASFLVSLWLLLIALAYPAGGSHPPSTCLQQNWARYPSNPDVEPGPPGSWDDNFVGAPMVLRDGRLYRMWYAGLKSDMTAGNEIGVAGSIDGVSWVKQPDPVLRRGPEGAWDSLDIPDASVLRHGRSWFMWYTGSAGGAHQVGLAVSGDGFTWSKHPSNPVLGGTGPWGEFTIEETSVMRHDGLFKMWYAGRDAVTWRIGYATSRDGVAWTLHPSPVLEGDPGMWDGGHVEALSVVWDGVLFHVWYTGGDGTGPTQIGYACSFDGLDWTKVETNPVLGLGSPGAWDDWRVINPTVLMEGNQLRMWYQGQNAANRASAAIGLATSPL